MISFRGNATMTAKNTGLISRPTLIDKMRAYCLRKGPLLIFAVAFVLSGLCWAEPAKCRPPAESSSPSSQERDQAALEQLKARKAALDMERAQLEEEQAELVGKILKIKARGPARVHYNRLKELNDRLAAHQGERDAFWDSYQSSQKDSSGFQALKSRKTALDIERAQLEGELAELVKIGQRVRTRRVLRTVRHKLRELNDRLVKHRKERDAFDKDLDAHESSQ